MACVGSSRVEQPPHPLYSAIITIRFLSEETVVKTGLTVVAHITAKIGCEDRVRQALLDLLAQTRN